MKPGADRDFTIFLWFVVGCIVLAATLLLLTDKAMASRPPKPIDWAKIASFYAGRPVTIGTDPRGPLGATTGAPESGQVLLGSGLRKSLVDFERYFRAGDRNRAFGLGVNALSILLHESMHNRHFTDSPYDQTNQNTGFRNAGSEIQAQALGAELIPDLLQRFFGIKIDSPLSRRVEKMAKGRGEYGGAYQMAKYIGLPPRPL